MKRILYFFLPLLLSLQSCIQEEPLGAECDILAVDSLWLVQNRHLLKGQPQVSNANVQLKALRSTDRTALAPRFVLTPGARLTLEDGATEANGLTRNFSEPQRYVCHSEDGLWHKTYEVAFPFAAPLSSVDFALSSLDASGRYYEWYQPNVDDPANPSRDWASGNAGYALTGMASTPDRYPTAPLHIDPLTGATSGVRLTTCATGSYGERFKMPIAAGNLFIGEFRAAQASLFPLKATRFGLPLVEDEPLRLEANYTYTPGPTVTDKQNATLEGRRDSADIYAVVYEIDPSNFQPLNGDDVTTSPRVVLLARLADLGTPTTLTHLSAPFLPQNGKTFSPERQRLGGYAIAIVATSSRSGAHFIGAVGSTLDITDMTIVWKQDEE